MNNQLRKQALAQWYLQKYYDKEYGFGFCAICSLAKLLSEIKDMDLLPTALYKLLRENNGLEGNFVKWSFVKNFFDVSTRTILWTKYRKKHTDLDLICPPCIISVDAYRQTKEYESHFVYLKNWNYELVRNNNSKLPYDIKSTSYVKKIVNGSIFDPINGELLVVPHYGNDLKNSIYSVINIKSPAGR